MRLPTRGRTAAALAMALLAGLLPAARAESSLDSAPARIRYLSNEAPFVVFGVTPTRLHGAEPSLTLSFVATEPLREVRVFPLVRLPQGQVRMAAHTACGPRDVGSWDCAIPAAELLALLAGAGGEFGLRIEADGDLHAGQHSTVMVSVPVTAGPRPGSVADHPGPLRGKGLGPAGRRDGGF